MKIALINPHIDPELAYGRRFAHLGAVLPPLGLCYLAGVLKKDHSIRIVDANMQNMSNDLVVQSLVDNPIDMIGIYATSLGIDIASDLCARIKKRMPDIPVVLGGPHISGLGKDALASTLFDFGITGEGEISLQHLARTLETGGADFTTIPGLLRRKGTEIAAGAAKQYIQNLDDIPFPARELLPSLRHYHPKKMYYKRLPLAHIFTSRGCPYFCIFCQTPFGKKVRFHSAKYVADEITLLVKDFGVQEIKINDDTFNLIESRVYEIFDILERRGIRLPWACNIRVDSVKDKSFFTKVKKSGCWLVNIGLETGNAEVLKALKKGTTLEQASKVCRWAYDEGLKIQGSFIIGNPLETESTIADTIRFAKSLPIHYPSFAFMTPFPGTEMWTRASEFGEFTYKMFSDLRVSHRPSFIPKGITRKKMAELYKKAYREAYLNPGMIFRQIKGIRSISELARLCSGASTVLKLKRADE